MKPEAVSRLASEAAASWSPVLALFHWAHRFRYLLHDLLRLKHHDTVIGVLCYGGALVGSVVAGYLVLLVQ